MEVRKKTSKRKFSELKDDNDNVPRLSGTGVQAKGSQKKSKLDPAPDHVRLFTSSPKLNRKRKWTTGREVTTDLTMGSSEKKPKKEQRNSNSLAESFKFIKAPKMDYELA